MNIPKSFNDFKNTFSRTTYLLTKNPTGYDAYLMTIIADSVYIGNNFSKLSNNTYKKYDKNFSGYLIYHDVSGHLISGYVIKTGKITQTILGNPTPNKGILKLKTESTKTMGVGCSWISVPVFVGYISTGNSGNFALWDNETIMACTDDGSTGGGGTGFDDPDNGFPPPLSGDMLEAQILQSLFENDPEFEENFNNATDAERALIRLHPLEAYAVYQNSKDAIEATGINFPNSLTQHNDIADAFRHAVWNALNTKDIGASEAAFFGNAHEDFPTNPPLEKTMDLTNNELGRVIATALLNANPSTTEAFIVSTIRAGAIQGSLVMIGIDTNTSMPALVPTHM